MKMLFIQLLCLVSLAFAEPPVGEGYAARSSLDHHHDQHEGDQRSLSQEYGPPNSGSARNAPPPGYEYNSPNTRSSSNSRGQSRFPPATVRVSFNQRFGSASSRNSAEDSTLVGRTGLSQEYGAPASRSLSQEYGAPSVSSARTLSTEYGMPDARSTPSQEYGTPVIAARNNQKPLSSSFRKAQPASRSNSQADSLSHEYNAPSSRLNDDKRYQASAVAARRIPSSQYSAPSTQSHSTSHSDSSARNAETLRHDSISQTYSAPNQRDLSETHATPEARGISQEYGVPSSRANLMTSAVASKFASASSRSSPSTTYLPVERNAAPSDQYGVPEQRDAESQGYDYARARALEELQNQEPASYDFGYQIEDQESGSDFGHTETREENSAQGSYFVVLPDGNKQTVQYSADERGFQPRISVDRAAGGYQEDAAGVSTSQGPY